MMKPVPPIEAAIDSPLCGLCASDTDPAAAGAPARGLALLAVPGPADGRKRRAEAPADELHVASGPSVANGAPEVPLAPPTWMGVALKWWRR